jgi:hypothetical protein
MLALVVGKANKTLTRAGITFVFRAKEKFHAIS